MDYFRLNKWSVLPDVEGSWRFMEHLGYDLIGQSCTLQGGIWIHHCCALCDLKNIDTGNEGANLLPRSSTRGPMTAAGRNFCRVVLSCFQIVMGIWLNGVEMCCLMCPRAATKSSRLFADARSGDSSPSAEIQE